MVHIKKKNKKTLKNTHALKNWASFSGEAVAGRDTPAKPERGSCIMLRNDSSKQTHMLTKQETLLGRGAWAERRRVREPGGLFCHVACSLGFYSDGISFQVVFGQSF